MKLYHFTCSHFIDNVRICGLNRGWMCVVTALGGVKKLPNRVWLTKEPSFSAQGWATRNTLTCDRTEWRLTIDIPEERTGALSWWPEIRRDGRFDREWLDAFEEVGGSENWHVFAGVIPRSWITAIDAKPAALVASV